LKVLLDACAGMTTFTFAHFATGSKRFGMIFLIEYERKRGCLIQIRSYENSDRPLAEQARLELELWLRRSGKSHEVVILEAADEAALRKTHRRYFEDLAKLAKAAG